MEPFCAKTVLLNLAKEHGLEIASLTTDRSTSVKTALRSAKHVSLHDEYILIAEAPHHFLSLKLPFASLSL